MKEKLLTNIQSQVVKGMLTQHGISLICDMVREIVYESDTECKEGTYIIIGQKRGEKPQEILRFNLCDGEINNVRGIEPGPFYIYRSDRAVEAAIDEFLVYPRKKLSCEYEPHPYNFAQLNAVLAFSFPWNNARPYTSPNLS